MFDKLIVHYAINTSTSTSTKVITHINFWILLFYFFKTVTNLKKEGF